MSRQTPTVFVVDDDDSIRRSLSRLLRSEGYQVEMFASASDFLAGGFREIMPACLILDITMPGLTGMDLQQRLTAMRSPLSIIFITGHGDIPTSVQAMKNGAVDFLTKPFDDSQLLAAVARAIEKNAQECKALSQIRSIQQRFETLTAREREVMALIVTGKLNKQVAGELGATEKTIKVHRARVLEKMQVQSVTELVPLAARLGLV